MQSTSVFFFIVFPFLSNSKRAYKWIKCGMISGLHSCYVCPVDLHFWEYQAPSSNWNNPEMFWSLSWCCLSSSFCHLLFSRVRYCRLRWQKFPPLQVQSEAYEHVQRCGFLKVQEHAGGWSLIPRRRTTWRLYYPGTAEGEALLAHQPGWGQLSLLVHILL